MAANTPVLLRAAMVDGRTDLGLMSSGQVAGLIDDLPSCAELIESHHGRVGATLDRLDGRQEGVKPGPFGLQAFDDRDVGLAAALAHGLQAVAAAGALSSWSSVVSRRAPVAPSGWPSAIAPPLTFTRSRSAPVSCCQARTHRGERLVDLDQVDVVQGEPGALAGRGRSRGSAR